MLGDTDSDGLIDALGLIDADGLMDGERDADGLIVAIVNVPDELKVCMVLLPLVVMVPPVAVMSLVV